MNRFVTFIALIALVPGCGPEFQIRKEPDLQTITDKELARLKHVRIDPDFHALLSAKSEWQIHTSLDHRTALNDDDLQSVASSKRELSKGDWILIDLRRECLFQRVRQHHGVSGQPRTYRVDTASERGFPFQLQFVGSGDLETSVATFPRPTRGRFIRVTLLDDAPERWQVAELEID